MSRRNKTVAVLGCGPAGLLAAHACDLNNVPVNIFSVKKPSPIGGAQYLHVDIPGLTDRRPDAFLKYVVKGDAYTYQRKAYGRGVQPGFVSFSHVQDGLTLPCWNLRKAYERLWNTYGDSVVDQRVTYSTVQELLKDHRFVVVAVPKHAICIYRDGRMVDGVPHSFQHQEIQIKNDCLPPVADNTILYDGTNDLSWYRASVIFGVGSTEWGSHVGLPFPQHEIIRIKKPVSTNCSCWRKQGAVLPVGRFGKWKKGELTHHAFENVMEALR